MEYFGICYLKKKQFLFFNLKNTKQKNLNKITELKFFKFMGLLGKQPDQ